MNVQNIQAEKLTLINWITEIQDVSLLKKLKKFYTKAHQFSDEKEQISIPFWQMEESRKRLAEYEKNPEIGIDFELAMNEIEKDL